MKCLLQKKDKQIPQKWSRVHLVLQQLSLRFFSQVLLIFNFQIKSSLSSIPLTSTFSPVKHSYVVSKIKKKNKNVKPVLLTLVVLTKTVWAHMYPKGHKWERHVLASLIVTVTQPNTAWKTVSWGTVYIGLALGLPVRDCLNWCRKSQFTVSIPIS